MLLCFCRMLRAGPQRVPRQHRLVTHGLNKPCQTILHRSCLNVNVSVGLLGLPLSLSFRVQFGVTVGLLLFAGTHL